MGIAQALVMYCKRKANHMIGQLIFSFTYLVYLTFVLYAMYIVKVTLEPKGKTLKEKDEYLKKLMGDNQVGLWLFIEVIYFWLNVFSQMVFLMVAHLRQFSSILKRKYDDKEIKKVDDAKKKEL